MQLKKSQYTTLLRFAFLPPSVMEFASRKYQFDHLAAYLQFSFEKNMKCSRIVENDNHAFFNTGLQNKAGDFLYAFFIPNENKRQKWAFRYIASASELQITAAPDPPVCTLQDFERDSFDFSYAHSDKYQPLTMSFSTVQEAREHIRRVFKNAHQLGYIIYENNQAIFHTGVKSADNAYYYAVFSKNKNAKPEWYLNGFYTKPLGFSVLPEYVFEIEQQSAVSVSPTLFVSVNIADLDALKTVLHEEQLRFSERSDRTASLREFSYLSIPKLNAIAVLTGQSYHCFIPIIQAILRFHLAQAVFTETASDNITQSLTTISNAVRNPEQAKRSDSDLEADPILCSLFSNLPNIPVHPVIETITDDAPNRMVLAAMEFYIISFSKGYLPVRKKHPQQILTWKNDAVLDRLLARNEKINQGATLDSLRADMAEKEEAVRRMERTKETCKSANPDTEEKLNTALMQAENELRDAADFLTTAEQVLGGTFLQETGEAERHRREAAVLPNGIKPGGNRM